MMYDEYILPCSSEERIINFLAVDLAERQYSYVTQEVIDEIELYLMEKIALIRSDKNYFSIVSLFKN